MAHAVYYPELGLFVGCCQVVAVSWNILAAVNVAFPSCHAHIT